MKKTFAILLSLALILTLAACKNEPADPPVADEQNTASEQEEPAPDPDDEPEDITEPMPEASADDTATELSEANDILNLLSMHDSVTIDVESSASDGTDATSSKYEYFSTQDGICFVQSSSINAGARNGSIGSAKTYGFQSDDVSGVIFSVPGAGTEDEGEPLSTLTLCPSNDYLRIATMNQSLIYYNQAAGSRTVTESVEENDGKLILSEKTTIQDMPYYIKSVYTVNPETMEILSAVTTCLSTEDDSVEWTSKIAASYNQPHGEIDPVLTDKFINSENGCKLTLVINPGTTAEETQSYQVAKDVMVYFQCVNSAYELFSDRECTNPVSAIDVTKDSLEIYVKTS